MENGDFQDAKTNSSVKLTPISVASDNYPARGDNVRNDPDWPRYAEAALQSVIQYVAETNQRWKEKGPIQEAVAIAADYADAMVREREK